MSRRMAKVLITVGEVLIGMGIGLIITAILNIVF
jgi:hypothetical protein